MHLKDNCKEGKNAVTKELYMDLPETMQFTTQGYL